MNDLKTLKDLSAEEWKDRKEFVELWVRLDEVRQLAIKWVKDAKYTEISSIRFSKCPKCGGRLEYDEHLYMCKDSDCDSCWDAWQLFFIAFHNITEEELK